MERKREKLGSTITSSMWEASILTSGVSCVAPFSASVGCFSPSFTRDSTTLMVSRAPLSPDTAVPPLEVTATPPLPPLLPPSCCCCCFKLFVTINGVWEVCAADGLQKFLKEANCSLTSALIFLQVVKSLAEGVSKLFTFS